MQGRAGQGRARQSRTESVPAIAVWLLTPNISGSPSADVMKDTTWDRQLINKYRDRERESVGQQKAEGRRYQGVRNRLSGAHNEHITA
jgi:hypothetical protein